MSPNIAGASCFKSAGITVLCADFFDISPTDLPHVDGVYDRASLIALPETMRPDYARHIAGMIPDTTRSLLITLDYPQQEMKGTAILRQ